MKASGETPQSPPPFRVLRPSDPGPLIFAAGHAGRLYPDLERTPVQGDPARMRGLEDPLIDQLIAPAVDHGVTVILFDLARAYVDVNRDPREIDPLLLSAPAPDRARPTARTRAGLGVVPRLAADGRPLLASRLTLAEIDHRIDQAHRPYHAALDSLAAEARARFGNVLLIDWHSMPSAAARAEQQRGGVRPDMVLGDRHGAACSSLWSGAVRQALAARGRRVVMNRPYAGGHVTERLGAPGRGVHAIQIEIDRALYVDETSLHPLPGTADLAEDILAVASALRSRLKT